MDRNPNETSDELVAPWKRLTVADLLLIRVAGLRVDKSLFYIGIHPFQVESNSSQFEVGLSLEPIRK